MNDLTRVSIVSPAETALRKLKKSEIGVYDCKKEGARFIFSVKDKHVKKVFALFNKPCYNIRVEAGSLQKKGKLKLFNRLGLLIGGIVLVAAVYFSGSFVFKISVGGSGAYLENEVRRIIYEEGAKEFSRLNNFDYPSATGKILSLPQVTFCSIKKRGSVLVIDVEVNTDASGTVKRDSLKSDRSGTVKSIVAICGTACVKVGDFVESGTTLIGAYVESNEQRIDSIAVGYAELECKGQAEYFAAEESEENLKSAYSSVLIYSDEILSRTHKVEEVEGGVKYIIDFTYLHKLIINME